MDLTQVSRVHWLPLVHCSVSGSPACSVSSSPACVVSGSHTCQVTFLFVHVAQMSILEDPTEEGVTGPEDEDKLAVKRYTWLTFCTCNHSVWPVSCVP